VNGLLVVDKPGGMTSHDVVGRLRRITGEKSIGHLGTLDPMATGVLPLLMGKFTRLAQYFSSAEKSYAGSIRLGFATDTFDAEGEPAGPDVWPEVGAAITLERIRAAAGRFHGEMLQMPPPYSAKKIAGTPAYKLAREGKPVELKAAAIRIDSFEITGREGAEAEFTMSISAGGYVRSLAHELGRDLGCGAHLSRLRRTQAGAFTLDDAHTLEELERLAIEHRPELEGLRKGITKRQDEAQATRLTAKPDFTVALGYMLMPTGSAARNAYMAEVTMNLPGLNKARHEGEAKQADAATAVAQADLETRTAAVFLEVRRAQVAIAASEKRTKVYRDTLLPQAEAAFKAASAAYQNNRAEFSTLIDSENLLLDIQTALYTAASARDAGMADLERAIGTAAPDKSNGWGKSK